MAVKHVTEQTYAQEVLQSDVPVLVDFWATWCGPCRMIAPFVDKIAEEYDGRAAVAKVDVDENPAVAAKYGITSIPTLLVIKGGEVVAKQVGAVTKAKLGSMLDAAMD